MNKDSPNTSMSQLAEIRFDQDETKNNYTRATKSSRKKEVILSTYGEPHKFGDIPPLMKYDTESPLRMKPKREIAKVHPLTNNYHSQNDTPPTPTSNEELVSEFQLTPKTNSSSNIKKKSKCKHGSFLLKGFILTTLVSSVATFVILYVNERNEKESLKDELKLYKDGSERIIYNKRKEIEDLHIKLRMAYNNSKNENITAFQTENLLAKHSKEDLLEKEREIINERRDIKFSKFMADSFFSISKLGGLTLWQAENPGLPSSIYTPIRSYYAAHKHRRGVLHTSGLYIVGGLDDMKAYFYDLKGDMMAYVAMSLSDHVRECFLKNTTTAICCDIDGYLTQFDLNASMALSYPASTFVYNNSNNDNFYSCTQIGNGNILAGGRNMYIFDSSGNYLGKSSATSSKVLQIAEIRPNIIITAESSKAVLHDISDPSACINNVLPDIGDYASVISLSSNVGDFAIGGKNFLKISHLENDNTTIIILREKINMPINNNCAIYGLKEIKPGIILFGGRATDCTEMCIWYYEIATEPVCWPDHSAYDIYDFIPVPQ